MNNRQSEKGRLQVTCRAARPSDTADVMELTRMIWDGEDYVPHVWQDWLADPDGQLVVAEHQGRVLGLGKLTRLSEEDWWFEGLRVHPEYEGRGIASQIQDYMVDLWISIGKGNVRLATASFRHAVHHLCERSGFEKVGELTFFVARARKNRRFVVSKTFQSIAIGEVKEAMEFAQHSPSLRLNAGLIGLGWRWAPPRQIYFERLTEKHNLLWWRGKQGLLSFYEDDDPQGVITPVLQFAAGKLEDLGAMLNDFRLLAGSLGYTKAAWIAPLHPELLPILEAARFKRDWDACLYLYAKRHPQCLGE